MIWSDTSMKRPDQTRKPDDLCFTWDPKADRHAAIHPDLPVKQRDLDDYFDFLMEVNPAKFAGIKKHEFCSEKFVL